MQITKQEAYNILTQDFQEKQSRNHIITYTKNIFIPITHICQNNCGYCTFKETPEETEKLLMTKQEIEKQIQIAQKHNITEALFTFGESSDKNPLIKEVLKQENYNSMSDYVYTLSENILKNTNILPHTNMGIITKKELKKLKEVNASMGLMLETTNKKLLKTITHKNSPGKRPSKRIRLIKQAGKLKIPFTTGLLIGIGESTDDHIDSLYKIREIQDKYHHIQEIIIQNFKPKKGTPMENYPEPKQETMIRLVHLAKILFPDISIQIPPNLNSNQTNKFIQAGADDLGGISTITKDYVNPNEEWPNIINIKNELGSIGYELKERLPVYKKFRKSEYLSEIVYDKCIKLNKKKEYL